MTDTPNSPPNKWVIFDYSTRTVIAHGDHDDLAEELYAYPDHYELIKETDIPPFPDYGLGE